MDRLISILLMGVLVAVLGLSVVTWRADQQARADRNESLCLERAQATALVATLVPQSEVDVEGRIDAARTLGEQVDGC